MISCEILGVVLAGGAGRRMGRSKGELPWRGTTLAGRAASVLAGVCGEVVVSGPDRLAADGVAAIPDLFPGRGPLGGLHAGLERAAGRAIFALACDMPFVGPELVRYLVERWDGRRSGAWVAAGEAGAQTLCGVYAPAGRAVAEARLRAGLLSVRGFFEAVGGTAVAVTPELELYRPELLANLNRPHELRRARRLAGAPEGERR